MPDKIIELDSVKLSLPSAAGPVNILRGIDLSIAKGETAGLVGPSGSGKSTLLMVLAGLERPSSGRITCAGEDLTSYGEDRLARFRRDHIGIVFQSFHLIPTMTALVISSGALLVTLTFVNAAAWLPALSRFLLAVWVAVKAAE